VCRATEDRAGAVLHQHEIRHVDWKLPVGVERMNGLHPGIEALLLRRLDQLLRGAVALALGDEFGERGILRRRCRGERMVRRDRHELGAEQRVVARREDFKFVFTIRRGAWIEREADQQPFRAADPVVLHQAHILGPAIKSIEAVQQVLRERGDFEEPLGQLALLDKRVGAPAAAVDHLLVCQHRLLDRIPIDLGFLALHEPGPEKIEEEFLLVLVVGRIAGRDLAAPIDRQAHQFELRAHRRDVVVGPFARVNLALDGGILGGQTEGVPAHRMQHIQAHRALIAGDHIADRVVAHMADVQLPGWIGEHLKHVVFWARIVVAGGKNLPLFPHLLPAGLGLARVVAFARHGNSMPANRLQRA